MKNTRLLALLAFVQIAAPSSAQTTVEKIDVQPKETGVSSLPWAPGGKSRQPDEFGLPKLGSQLFFTAETEAFGRELYVTDGTAAGSKLYVDTVPGPATGMHGDVRTTTKDVFYTAGPKPSDMQLFVLPGGLPTPVLISFTSAGDPIELAEHLVPIGDKLFFTGSTSSSGFELMISDGTVAGTHVVADLVPGSGSSYATGVFPSPIAGEVLFQASLNGQIELWRSDGTSAGTSFVSVNSMANPVVVGSRLVFKSWDPVFGEELYATDGTSVGTGLLVDITPGPGSSSLYPSANGVLGNDLYFSLQDFVSAPTIYRTDGTPAGTQKLFTLPAASAGTVVGFLGTSGGQLFVAANPNPGGVGAELYKVSTVGLTLVKDLMVGSLWWNDSNPTNAFEMGGALYFQASTDTPDVSLYKTDGTAAGTTKVAPILEWGVKNGLPMAAVSPTQLVFSGGTAWSGSELFTTDGTALGTGLLKDLAPSLEFYSSNPEHFSVVHGDKLFFAADTDLGSSLVAWTAKTGVEILTDHAPVEPLHAAWLGDHEFLSYVGKAPHFLEFCQTDGTVDGTTIPPLFPPGVGQTVEVLGTNGKKLFLSVGAAPFGRELWVSDGSPVGTFMVTDLNPGPLGSVPRKSVLFQNDLYFVADGGAVLDGLWKSDGTAGGTVLVKDFLPGQSSSVHSLTVVGDKLFLAADDGIVGTELWLTDGTTAGTVLLKDMEPGPGGSSPVGLTALGGKLTCLAYSSAGWNVMNLWESDGTTAGTVAIALPPMIHFGAIQSATAGGVMFFQAGLYTTEGVELWSYDGSNPPAILADIFPGPSSSGISEMTVCGDLLYFTAFSPSEGFEVFVSDGTAAGTHIAVDLVPGPDGSIPKDFVVCDGALMFSAEGPDGDRELYRLTSPGPHAVDLGFGGGEVRLEATTPHLGLPFTMTVSGVQPGDLSVLAFSLPAAPSSDFMASGSASWLDPFSAQVVGASLSPSWLYTRVLPVDPALAGATVHAQAWLVPGQQLPAKASNGIRLVL